uniref:Uncharacterized protein n=1 Tax=Oryza brachyantha TaxID=4533 RepID=J3L876_ORYBR
MFSYPGNISFSSSLYFSYLNLLSSVIFLWKDSILVADGLRFSAAVSNPADSSCIEIDSDV